MRRLKVLMTSLLGVALLTTTVFASSFTINVAGATISSSNLIYNVDRRVMVPISNISNNLGYTKHYDAKTKTIYLTSSTGRTVALTDGQRYAVVGGSTVQMPAATMQKDGKAYMSFVGIRQVFNADITWNTETKTIFVATTNNPSNNQQDQTSPNKATGTYTKYGVTNYTEESITTYKALAEKAKTINDSELILAKDDKVVKSIKDIGVFVLTDLTTAELDSLDEIVVFDHESKIAYTTKEAI